MAITAGEGTGSGKPVSDPIASRTQIDALLNHLLCELVLAGGTGEETVAYAADAVAELIGLVGGLASPVLALPIAAVAAARRPDELERALTTFSELWQVWQVHDESAPELLMAGGADRLAAPASSESCADARELDSRVEADLAALRSDPELAGVFIAEALDHLGTIETCVLRLESAPGDSALLNDIFRPFHTVKGNAGALGVSRVQELAHRVENLLGLCREGQRAFGPAETDVTLEAVDVLSALMNDLQARLNGQPGSDLEPKRLRLMDAVDRLVSGGGVDAPRRAAPQEVSSDPMPLRDRASDTSPHEQTHLSHPPAETAPVQFGRRVDDALGQLAVKVDTRKLDNLVDIVGELVIAQAILQEHPALLQGADERLTRNLAHLRRITSDLQRNAMSMRMVPIRQTFQKMARLVRDLSKKSGKPIDLVLSGEDTELDRRVVEDISDPLMHMVRNSIDHGIEEPSRRLQAGKRPEGRLALSAYHQGGDIVIAIEDDGGGLNPERILAKAVKQGLVDAGATLTTAQIRQLIFEPGFSTADTITEISGRGVGMDVVRRNIDALRGRIDVQSTVGAGTTFLIRLPLTLAILDGLILGVGAERFVLPIYAVRESLRPRPGQVHSARGRVCMIQVRDTLIPLVRLAELYGIDGSEEDLSNSMVVIVEDDGHQVGLVVDRLLGKQEVVIKSLGPAFGQICGVAGGAILGDGRVGLILDAHGIAGRPRGEDARAA